MRSFITALYLLVSCSITAQLSIHEVKTKPIGSVVTFEGVVTTGDAIDETRFVQDSTAAIPVFGGGSAPAGFYQLEPGDLVEFTGLLIDYRGLIEISPLFSFEVISQGNPLPEAFETTFDSLAYPQHHGKRAAVKCVLFERTHGVFEEGKQRLYDQSGARTELYLERGHPLIGTDVPDGPVDLSCISSFEYKPIILISEIDALKAAACPFVLLPEIVDITTSGVSLTWESSEPGFAAWRYGISPDSLKTKISGDLSTMHIGALDSVAAASVAYFQPGFSTPEDIYAWGPLQPYITSSESSGEVEIYFNNDVAETLPAGPEGTTFGEIMDRIFAMISSARERIDIAAYNINRDDIVNALEVAYASGIQVRYIADADQGNNALDPLPDFPVLFRNGAGIMHNKFIIVDPDDEQNAQVWTGATNFTTNQLAIDPNNAILIQDQSLARVFEMEFEEMWGGDGPLPNTTTARQGEQKRDNTPHHVKVGESMIEVYFSPSDYTAEAISHTIRSSTSSLDAALLLITHEELARDMADAVGNGVEARMIVHEIEPGSVSSILQSGGVDLRDYPRATIFHHKTLIADVGTDQPRLLTGSHNWTYSADNINDENTLIIHDPDIAAVYDSEYRARWSEVATSTSFPSGATVLVYPNPFGKVLMIDASAHIERFELLGVDGRTVRTWAGNHGTLDTRDLMSGSYVLRLTGQNGEVAYAQLVKF